MKTLDNSILRILLLLFVAMCFVACGDDNDDNTRTDISEINLNANTTTGGADRAVSRLEMPNVDGSISSNSVLLVHRTSDTDYDADRVNYIVEWDYQKKSQRWTCYQLHRGYTGGASGRFDGGYPQDPLLDEAYRLDQDYFYGSGFDHGHICPNADRLGSTEARDQTYYLTNMQPQYRCFNGYQGSETGLWLRLEQLLRSWQPDNNYHISDTLFICKGGTIDKEENIIKRISGKLIVPKYFFMAVLKKSVNKEKVVSYQAIGFFMEQKNEYATHDDLRDYAVSIDELESLTGIDFFCNLPDQIETSVEQTLKLNAWTF